MFLIAINVFLPFVANYKAKSQGMEGYAFEMVCFHHLSHIKNTLGISGVQ